MVDEEDSGRTFGERWLVLELLGFGGSGRVWRVRDLLTGREAALKLIRCTSVGQRERVQREIAALQTLRIPGVVQLLDVGEHLGEPYLVTEFVPGRAFPGMAGRRSWPELREAALRLLDVVARIHTTGILHRDLKPANVLVTPEGRVVVLDFGLARGTPGEHLVTRAGGVVGTPRYLAPEQLAGAAVDARADLYAVGVMLYDALTGTAEVESAVFARTNATAGFPPIAQVAPDVPPGVARVLDALLSDTPVRRPRSAAEVRRLLINEDESEEFGIALNQLATGPLLDEVAAAVAAGRDVDIEAPRGSGRTRFVRDLGARLDALGLRWMVARAGRRPMSSLRLAAGETAFLQGPAATEDAVRARLGAGEVLLVDGLDVVDAWSRRIVDRVSGCGVVVRIGVGSAPRSLRPFTELELRELFHGPDLFHHLREDGAALLFERTGGLAARVARELDAWVAVGLARLSAGRVEVKRHELEQLATAPVVPPEAARDIDEQVDPGLVELLSWLTLAGDVTPAQLAQAMERPTWEIEVGVEELIGFGLASMAGGGNVRAHSTPPSVHLWPEERLVQAHRALADAMPEDSEARIVHLLAAGEPGAAVPGAVACARKALGRGRAAHAFGVLQLLLARIGSATAPDELLIAHGEAARADSGSATLQLALHTLERRREPLAGTISRVIAAHLACGRGAFSEARTLSLETPPVPDPSLDSWRYATLVRCALREGNESPDAWINASEAAYGHVPGVASRAASWRGLLAYDRLDFDAAVANQTRAVELADSPVGRAVAMTNLLNAHVERLDFDEVGRLAVALADLGRELRLPKLETNAATALLAARYSQGLPIEVGAELLEASAVAEEPVRHARLCTTACADAWRRGDRVAMLQFARLAIESAERSGWIVARAFASALGVLTGAPEVDAEAAAGLARSTTIATVKAHALAMIAYQRADLVGSDLREIIATVAAMPCPEVRREVLSPREMLDALDRA